MRVVTKCFLDRVMEPVNKVKVNFFPATKEGLEAVSPCVASPGTCSSYPRTEVWGSQETKPLPKSWDAYSLSVW